MSRGWIGVDLDGTLAMYSGYQGQTHIGEPVPAMLNRVKQWLRDGKEVRIFTARVYDADGSQEREREILQFRRALFDWLELHVGQQLRVTCQKDFSMIQLWDDRCVQVIANTGKRADGKD